MGDLESRVKNTARAVLATPKFVAETVLAIDNLKSLRRLKKIEAVQRLEPVRMTYGGAAEARVCYIASTIFKWAANGEIIYGLLDAQGYVPHGTPLFANLFFGYICYNFGIILHYMGKECVGEARKAVGSVIKHIDDPL